MKRALLAAALATMLTVGLVAPPSAQQPRAEDNGVSTAGGASPASIVLVATRHPRLVPDLAQLWFAPAAGRRTDPAEWAGAVKLVANREHTKALSVFARDAMRNGALADYAVYYTGVSQLALQRYADAKASFRAILGRKPLGYLAEAAAIGAADAHEGLGEFAASAAIFERLSKAPSTAPDRILMRLGLAAKGAGERGRAAAAWSRLYYEFPLSEHAAAAGSELNLLGAREPLAAGNARFKRELARAERLFAARQYAAARSAFEALQRVASGDDRELTRLRVAECNYYLKRARAARDGLRPFISGASRQAEARYFYARALRDLGLHSEYLKTARRVVEDFPDSSWAEDALNSLATHYILVDDDAAADVMFRELYARFPKGRHAERAAWKVGWRAYRHGKYDDTLRYFERAAADFPRSDYRPGWLYWSARAYEALGEKPRAMERHALVLADYQNSYYGRLSARRGARAAGTRVVLDGPPSGETLLPQPPPNEPLVRALIAAQLYDEADAELRYAQRVWGESSAIQATRAWIAGRLGQDASGRERFNLLRGSINGMRRAYPQFMAAGGEDLPREILTVIFPMAYWDLIRKHSTARDLDPYLVAALVAQESTFVPDIVSSARAVGLMQLMPATARRYARKLGLRYSAALLRNPEANVRMGTAYFSDMVKMFGDLHLVLASYNAGETPVRRWVTERPGIDADEFVDDIPYPETQNYVKRILGTAEDYRRLYAE